MELENFPTSESAKQMMETVTQGFYDKSYVAKWLFQVMGIEWDKVKKIVEELPEQIFPQTVTWALEYQEQKYNIKGIGNEEERRKALIKKVTVTLPFNPENVSDSLSKLTGLPKRKIIIEEYPKEIRFVIVFDRVEKEDVDLDYITNYLIPIKPAHIVFSYKFVFNSWKDLNKITWKQARQYTWKQIRTVDL